LPLLLAYRVSSRGAVNTSDDFQMRMPAAWALEFEDDLARLHLVHQIGKTAITVAASNLKLQYRSHGSPARFS
jgi:hypothetical protein